MISPPFLTYEDGDSTDDFLNSGKDYFSTSTYAIESLLLRMFTCDYFLFFSYFWSFLSFLLGASNAEDDTIYANYAC